MSSESLSRQIQAHLDRLHGGDRAAREALLGIALGWMRRLTSLMLRDNPRVYRWEETDDVLQNATLRLCRALDDARPQTARQFCGLAALQVRRELIDLARHYYGPQGAGAHHASQAPASPQDTPGPSLEPSDHSVNPASLSAWTEFHDQVARLPEEEREVFELRWYQEVGIDEAAQMLGTSRSTVVRRYHAACRKLHDVFQGELPFG
jgi:RNA polymerase sigma-70 factor (ECF subfamily)